MAMFSKRFLSAICILFLVSTAWAQVASAPYVWRSVKVGAGGFIPGIVFSRLEKGLVYLRSDMGGCYRWDDAQKKWLPMYDFMGQSSYFGGESIAPDPIDPNVVYVAAGMYRTDPAAMLRSADKGKTWEIYPVSFRMGGNDDGRGVGERLAVDPNNNTILYFGSRHNGLQRSTDSARTWRQVTDFPIKGGGAVGLSFVVFDPRSGQHGSATKTIFVGCADPGDQHLFRSDDAGATWKAVAGGPSADLLPLKAEIDDDGILFLTYSDGAGPNGVTAGAVMKLNTATEQWTDITPEKGPDRRPGGYCGISLDRQHPGTLGVTTLNHWSPVDTVWRTTDGGQTWKNITESGIRDVSATPYLLWGDKQAKLGWWMAAFAIDPFDSYHAVYATGATVYATNDFSNVNKDQPTHWYPWVEGIEQTAIITLISPTAGAHLLSGFGDIGGYVHDDLDATPPQGMYTDPRFTTTVSLDYAEEQPGTIVRSGQANQGQSSFGYSLDGGHTWHPLTPPGRRRRGVPPIIVSADGNTFMVLTANPVITRDKGSTWTQVKGLPAGARPIADRVDPNTFYALDYRNGAVYVSSDGGASFAAQQTQGLPPAMTPPESSENPCPFQATLGHRGDLWIISDGQLFHSSDGGKTFVNVENSLRVEALSFGKAPAGSDYPAMFAYGYAKNLRAIWRSDDAGHSWLRVNDDQHQYGTRFRCIAGDPRVFGRVYFGTDGRGILYGEPAQ
jgi:xyloglucan-specific exo-beta-1,4-glucanase